MILIAWSYRSRIISWMWDKLIVFLLHFETRVCVICRIKNKNTHAFAYIFKNNTFFPISVMNFHHHHCTICNICVVMMTGARAILCVREKNNDILIDCVSWIYVIIVVVFFVYYYNPDNNNQNPTIIKKAGRYPYARHLCIKC